ncbi:MAG: DNA/RNA non-specific endonuclease [Muribaculaceae bacterium]|nr:DNA/RNA non-specific endonuclease [Muribaculaceae bacterium]MDE6554290.1 DNA/RNA non-specific endonuclease [Muribaculaceae bacterium]
MKLFGTFHNKLQHSFAAAFALALVMPAFYACNTGKDEPKMPELPTPDIPTPEEPVPATPGHYDGLEKVTIPQGLTSQIKEYTGFTLSFNKDNRTPNYVAWELLGTEVSTEWPRKDNFWQDTDLEGCPLKTEYYYSTSGYERGHMCPAADQRWSEKAMIDCFVMANMCPQIHDLNAGAWEDLEKKEREWAKRDSAVLIIAGPIYTDGDRYIEKSQIRVPDAFFKILLAPYIEEPRGIAFVYPHMKCPGNMQDYATSIDEVEMITGFDFFSELPDEIEDKVESTFSFADWNK